MLSEVHSRGMNTATSTENAEREAEIVRLRGLAFEAGHAGQRDIEARYYAQIRIIEYAITAATSAQPAAHTFTPGQPVEVDTRYLDTEPEQWETATVYAVGGLLGDRNIEVEYAAGGVSPVARPVEALPETADVDTEGDVYVPDAPDFSL